MPTSLTKAVWQGKCPHCRQGSIFKYPLTKIFRFGEMHDKCPHCDISFMPEPGFYFGALYVSYGFTIGLFIGLWLILYLAFNPPDWVYIYSIILAAVLFIPVSFRYSRILFLYWFGGIDYDERA